MKVSIEGIFGINWAKFMNFHRHLSGNFSLLFERKVFKIGVLKNMRVGCDNIESIINNFLILLRIESGPEGFPVEGVLISPFFYFVLRLC